MYLESFQKSVLLGLILPLGLRRNSKIRKLILSVDDAAGHGMQKSGFETHQYMSKYILVNSQVIFFLQYRPNLEPVRNIILKHVGFFLVW